MRPDLSDFFQTAMLLKFGAVKFNRTKIELLEFTAERAIVNEEIMLSMFNYLAESIGQPRLKYYTGDALIKLCQYWSPFVIKNFESFLKRKIISKNSLIHIV